MWRELIFFANRGKIKWRCIWNGVFIQLLEENRVIFKNEDYDETPNIQRYFTETKLTTNSLDNIEEEAVFDILNNVGFYDMTHTKGLISARMKDAFYNSPKTFSETLNSVLPETEKIEDSNERISDIDLEGPGIEDVIIPSNIIDIYTRSEVFLGLDLSGHTNTLTEGSNLIDELCKRGEIQYEQQYRNALDNFNTQQMELPSEIFEQIAFNTTPKIKEHMLIVMDKSNHEEHLCQPLQTNIKQFKWAVTFLAGYNGTFNVTNSNNKFYFGLSITDNDCFFQITIPPGAYKIESSKIEISRLLIDGGLFTATDYPFRIKQFFQL